MSSRTLNWPRRIARTDRTPLATGHGSFLLRRVHLGDEAFDHQRIKLSGYLLVIVREGTAILDGANSSLLLQEGDTAFIPAGSFALTEIPRPLSTRGEVLLYFFNQRALAKLMTGREHLDEHAARIALPVLPFYPVRRVGAALDAFLAAGALKSMADLHGVFAVTLNIGIALVCNFLEHEYYIPRFRLRIFLEEQCQGKTDLKRIAARYPYGAHTFRRDCQNYLGLPVERWLLRRRVELAQAWLRYTPATEHEVARRLGYDEMRQFRGDLKRYGGFSPRELAGLRLLDPREPTAASRLPFRFPDGETRAEKERQFYRDFVTLHTTAPKPSLQKALLKRYLSKEQNPPQTPSTPFAPACQVTGGVDESDGQDGVPGNVISGGENLTVANGLSEDEVWRCSRRPLSTFACAAAATRSARTATPTMGRNGPSA